MNAALSWWYRLSLPNLPMETPGQREKARYARLTSGFLLLICLLFLPAAGIMIFDSPKSPSSPPIAMIVILILFCSFITGRMGLNILSASFLVFYDIFMVTGVLVSNPLDPSLLPLFGAFVLATIIASALMPPIASIIVGVICCLDISFIAFNPFMPRTAAFQGMLDNGLYTVTWLLPILVQIVISTIMFVVMTTLTKVVRRADRAEEIVALQMELATSQRQRAEEQRQLEEGFHQIAEVHARVANGDVRARVSLEQGHVLWSVAVPLNNLLNRMHRTQNDTDILLQTQQAAQYVASCIHRARITGDQNPLTATGTALDPVIVEINKGLPSAYSNRSN